VMPDHVPALAGDEGIRRAGTAYCIAMMRAMLRDGLGPALREDIGVLRAFMRIFNLLDAPADLMKDPRVLNRVMTTFQRRDERPRAEQPTRAELVERLSPDAVS